jgi:hypothetical protein
MKTLKVIFILGFFTFLCYSVFSQSNQDHKRILGLSGSIQENQFGIMLPVWISNDIVLAPVFDLKYAESIGTDFNLGLVSKFYFKNEKVSPYFGLRVGTAINLPSHDNEVETGNKIDLIGGPAFGAEYFFDEHFSFGIELQGNLTKSDEYSYRFGNPDGLNFNTATMIYASIYF